MHNLSLNVLACGSAAELNAAQAATSAGIQGHGRVAVAGQRGELEGQPALSNLNPLKIGRPSNALAVASCHPRCRRRRRIAGVGAFSAISAFMIFVD